MLVAAFDKEAEQFSDFGDPLLLAGDQVYARLVNGQMLDFDAGKQGNQTVEQTGILFDHVAIQQYHSRL